MKMFYIRVYICYINIFETFIKFWRQAVSIIMTEIGRLFDAFDGKRKDVRKGKEPL